MKEASDTVFPVSEAFSMSKILFSLFSPILKRSASHLSPEYFCKIRWIGKSSHSCDLRHIQPVIPQKRKTSLYTIIQQIVKNRCIHISFEQTAAFAAAQMDLFRQFLQCDLFCIMFLNIHHNTPDPLRIPVIS